MNIEEFIKEFKYKSGYRYFVKYQEDRKWYVLKVFNLYIEEIFIITKRVLINKDKCHKRIKLLLILLKDKEKEYIKKIEKIMED